MKKIKLLFCLLLSLAIIYSVQKIRDSYSIDNGIYYDGKSKSFVFNGDNVDLFNDLKGLMPGDKINQIIEVHLNNINHDVNMYVKLINNNEDIFEKLSIKLYNEDNLIFDNKKNLGEYNTPIKIYSGNNSKHFILKLTIEVPKELDNELEGLTSNFKWDFIIEDYGKYIELENPTTGSGINIYLYFCILFISLFVMLLLIISIFKESKIGKKTDA